MAKRTTTSVRTAAMTGTVSTAVRSAGIAGSNRYGPVNAGSDMTAGSRRATKARRRSAANPAVQRASRAFPGPCCSGTACVRRNAARSGQSRTVACRAPAASTRVSRKPDVAYQGTLSKTMTGTFEYAKKSTVLSAVVWNARFPLTGRIPSAREKTPGSVSRYSVGPLLSTTASVPSCCCVISIREIGRRYFSNRR